MLDSQSVKQPIHLVAAFVWLENYTEYGNPKKSIGAVIVLMVRPASARLSRASLTSPWFLCDMTKKT